LPFVLFNLVANGQLAASRQQPAARRQRFCFMIFRKEQDISNQWSVSGQQLAASGWRLVASYLFII
jgi:hypothetical protein